MSDPESHYNPSRDGCLGPWSQDRSPEGAGQSGAGLAQPALTWRRCRREAYDALWRTTASRRSYVADLPTGVTRDHLMRFILPVAALAVALLTVRAEAREVVIFENGNNILELCSQPYGTVAGGFCLGYIAGIADAANVTQSIGETINGGTACIPMGVPVTQAKDVVTNFLRKHPEQRSLGAVDLIVRALAEAFPCPPATGPVSRR